MSACVLQTRIETGYLQFVYEKLHLGLCARRRDKQ